MNKEEAIERLKQNKAAAEFYAGITQISQRVENELKDIEAFEMAIEALSTTNEQVVYCKDCINRGDIFRCPMDDTYTVNDNEFCSYGVKKTDLGIDPDTIRI